MSKGKAFEVISFVLYSKCVIQRFFKQPTIHELPTIHQWLDRTSYSEDRKKQLLREYLKSQQQGGTRGMPFGPSDFFECKSFIKDECYQEPKVARGINSFSDRSKVFLGPICQAVDDATFSMKHFVKHTNPREWPSLLNNKFGRNPVIETDFSAFESHHHSHMGLVVRFWMNHMIRNLGLSNVVKRTINTLMSGVNKLTYKHVTIYLEERLMSGALWTSSANGVLNLLIMSYLVLRTRHPDSVGADLADFFNEFEAVIEGDDGMCSIRSMQDAPSKELISNLGVNLEMEPKLDFTHASFCGVVCNVGESSIVTDPIKVLRNFFTLPMKYSNMRESKVMGLLRAKALSYKYVYGNAPVVGALCDRVLYQTRSCAVAKPSELGSYRANYVQQAAIEKVWQHPSRPTTDSRAIVERNFHVCMMDQLRMERKIMTLGDTIELDLSYYQRPVDVEHITKFYADLNCLVAPAPLKVPNYAEDKKLAKRFENEIAFSDQANAHLENWAQL